MFKRIMLSLTFLAAFSLVGVGLTNEADARRGWGGSQVRYYAPPRDYYYHRSHTPYRSYYRSYTPYRSYYRSYYAPRYYRGYSPYYGYPQYYYGPRRGVSVSFGF
jgi:hypothetical protein